jgi:aminopeptidase YwaD
MKNNLFVFVFIALFLSSKAQDTSFARKIINTLTSKEYSGRGYVNKGMDKAATYLGRQFKSTGLKPMNKKSYVQSYTMSVNTFPGRMNVVADGRQLIPGVHYIIGPESKGVSTGFMLFKKDSVTYGATDGKRPAPFVISLQKKLTWSVSTKQENYTVLELLKDSFPKEIKNIDVVIDAKFLPEFRAQNICGFIKGSQYPDSFLVFTAHYDHLGMMGKETIFPGANDNASGISMLLSLASWYAKPVNKPKCSIVFICFSAEEAGLLGSEYFVNHPLFALSKIKFLMNLDLLGTGDEGITVVNATEFKPQFELLKKINEEKKYLPLVKPRGKAHNSDHYWFSEKGVPCFFIYTMGGIKAYHDVYDISKTLPLTRFSEVFKLITDFANEL